MKLIKTADPKAFLRQVKKCSGKVLLTTPQGDQLDLNSALCQLVFALSAQKREYLGQAEVTCPVEEDYAVLKDYLE